MQRSLIIKGVKKAGVNQLFTVIELKRDFNSINIKTPQHFNLFLYNEASA